MGAWCGGRLAMRCGYAAAAAAAVGSSGAVGGGGGCNTHTYAERIK